MKRIIIIAIGTILLATGGVILLTQDAKAPIIEIKLSLAQQVGKDLTRGSALIDVRTSKEFAESHAKNAVLLPLADIQKGIYPQAAKDQPIYLYCRTGNRAGQAKIILEKAGFTNVINIGGLADWQNQGGEVISS